MAPKTSGDSTPGVSGDILKGIQDSFTTQEAEPWPTGFRTGSRAHPGPKALRRGYRKRGLLGGERHAGLPAVQTPDRAGDLEDLPGRT